MENSESITGPSLENTNVLREEDGKLHQAQETKVSETEGAPLKDKTRTAKKEDRKEESRKSSEDQTNKEQYSEKTMKELESQFVVPAAKLKDSSKCSDAPFYCGLCELKLFNIAKCHSHVRTKGHKRAVKTRGVFFLVSQVAPPSEHQSLALSKLLDSVFVEHGLCPVNDLPARQKVAEDVGKIVCAKFPECSVSIYGSSFTGFGLKESDVNLDLTIPEEVNVPHVLLSILDLLQKDEHYCDVKSEFDAKVPRILFKHISSGLLCELSPGNIKAYKTSWLLKKYSDFDSRVRTLVVALRYWARICNIDCQSEGGLPGYSLALMVIQFLQETKPPVLPRWMPSETIDENNTDVSDNFVGNNKENTGSLWFELFRFYCVDFDIPNLVISIKEPMPVTREKKKWSHRRIAVEDPFSSKRNVACSLSSDKAFDYFFTCWKNSFLYFSSVPTGPQNGPLAEVSNVRSNLKFDNKTGKNKKQESNVQADEEAIFQMEDLDSTIKQVESLNLSSNDSKDSSDSQRQIAKDSPSLKSKDQIDAENEVDITLNGSDCEEGSDSTSTKTTSVCSRDECLIPNAENNASDAALQNVVYRFDAQVFRGNSRPVKTCCFCKEDGHVKEQCPELKKPPLCRLPPMTARFGAVLDYVCKKCRADFEFEKSEVSYREKVLQNLEEYIHRIFPDARLFLFGSSKNGFGFRNSDIDICMTLENQAKEDVDFVDVIIELAKLLKKHKDCGNVLAITTAKVPIVKFYLRSCKREADISLYNTLALENTKMLATYAKLDDRVATLGYTVKVFAKVCDIGDASKGSLSSYAYILMLLHFLQQCNPPVIPVLQNLYTDNKPPEKIVDGWNCWFQSDLKKINSVWNQKEKNTLTAGLLWYGFLRYYTEEFDFEHDVVCCRRTKPLTKFEKMWTKHVFAIEDPFNLDHNLGAGVTRKMANYILTAFIRGRERFGIPRWDIPQELSQRYFFDVYYLTDGYEAPTDRNCRVCGKIGHIAKDCPHSKANRRIEQKKEEEERRLRKEGGENSEMSQKLFNARPRAASAPNKQGQNKNTDSGKPLTTGQPKEIPSRQETNVSSVTNLSKSQPDSQVVASPMKEMQDGKPGKNTENVGETVQSEIPQMQSPVQNVQTGLTSEEVVFGTEPSPRNVQSSSVNSSNNGNGSKTFPTETVQPSTLIKAPQLQEQFSHPGHVKPPGLCSPNGTGQTPHASGQGSPQRMPGSAMQSPPLNVSPASIFQGRPIVMGTPPRHHAGMFSPQGSPFVGSPIQHDLWLRQQGGIMLNPHSPPMRPLVPYPVSPETRPLQPQQQWRGDSEMTDHLGSPVRGHQRLTEHNHRMLPHSPPNISRNVTWPFAPDSPHHNLANYQDPAIVREQQFSLPRHHPPFPRGNSPNVPPQQIQFPHGTPPRPVVGSPQPVPQLPHQGAPVQPSIGTHMTGEQFINLMRAVEEKSKKVEVLPTKLPSNNEFEPKELHIAPKNLKVAKTPEEHKLLSNLSKVKSLWEGNATAGLQTSCPNPGAISEVDSTGHIDLLEQREMVHTVPDTKLPEKREAWVTDAENESEKDRTEAVQMDQDERDEYVCETQNEPPLLAEDNGGFPSEAVIKEERSLSGNAEASDEKLQSQSIKSELVQKSKQQPSCVAAASAPLEEVPKQKQRRGGRGRKPKGQRQNEAANSTPERQEKPMPSKQSKAKNSPARGHNPKSYDDVKGDTVKASPKKSNAERYEDKQVGPPSAHRGAEAPPRQMPEKKESKANKKDSEQGPEANKQDHAKSTRKGNPVNSPGDSSKGGTSSRGRRRPRSRTSKGGPGEEKQDTRNRSNSTPEKRQPKDS